MGRNEYHNDPSAPAPNAIVPAASAVVTDDYQRILLHRRSDNEFWTIPGGAMKIGESLSQTAVREVKEETGLDVRPLSVIGVYSSPQHVVAYSDGEVRQQFSVCFACELLGGNIQTSDESPEVRFVAADELADLPISDAIRRRIDDFFAGSQRAAFD